MNLRTRITITLLPLLLPVAIVIYLNYLAQRNAETDYYLKMVSLTVQNGAREINSYLRLKNKAFDVIFEEVRQRSINLHESDHSRDSNISVLMNEYPGFSMLMFTDTAGVIKFFRTATNNVTKHLLPRDVQGVKGLTGPMLEELESGYAAWEAKVPLLKKQALDLQEQLYRLTSKGEKNSLRYRDVQDRYVSIKGLASHPPIHVFEGGNELVRAAGLPFRDSTFLFTVPYISSEHEFLGYFVGVLDWSVIEDKCFRYKSELGYGGLSKVSLYIHSEPKKVGSDYGTDLQSAGPTQDIAQVVYKEDANLFLVSAPFVSASALTRLNVPAEFVSYSGNRNGSATVGAGRGKVKYLTANIPEENIQLHARQLFTRALCILFISAIALVLVIIFLADRIVRPLAKIAAMARRINQGELEERLKSTQGGEIGELVDTFNTMCDEVQLAQQSLREKNRELQISKERYQILFNNAPIPIAVSDLEGKVVEANKAAIELSGYSLEEIVQLDFTHFYKNPSDRGQLLNELRKNSISKKLVLDLVNRQGKVFTCRFTSILVEIDQSMYIYSMFEDISYQKQIEQEKTVIADKLHRAQRMEAIGVMASGVAHDLNNILTGLVGYPDLLLQKLPPESTLRKPIQNIQESGQRASLIVADLLTVSRGAASVKQHERLDTIIQEYLHSSEGKKLMESNSSIAVQYTCNWKEAVIHCSKVHVKKSIMNLITNGIEAIGDHGELLISLERVSVSGNEAKELALQDGEYALIKVSDTGQGISEKDLELIFEPFYTRKILGRSGTGLGLTIVWNTMQDHDGKIVVSSGESGTCFHLYFPAYSDHKPQASGTSKEAIPAGNQQHILVVDDEELPRDIAVQMLQQNGYDVASVSSGEEAVAYVKQNKVDLVVLDMLMPPGMNGYQTYKELIVENPGQKAILTSGFSESADVEKALHLGVCTLVKKPYSMMDLCRAVHQSLHQDSSD